MTRVLRRLARWLGLTALLIVVGEGAASLLLVVWNYWKAESPVLTRPSTMADTLVGWVGRPNTNNPNEYGPGIGVTTNARGFRGTREVDSAVPAGRLRVICSGDSFTEGYGVRDQETWCARLEHERPAFEAVNMAVAGYGIDQAFLWYRRDANGIQHQLHLLGVFHNDFERTALPEMVGVPKSMLVLEGDSLALRGVPVPPVDPGRVRTVNARREFRKLRFVEALGYVGVRDHRYYLGPSTYPLVERMLHELGEMHRADGRHFAVVYLPSLSDIAPGRLDDRRAWLQEAGRRAGVPIIDLTPAFRKEPADVKDRAFIAYAPPGGAPGITGHYSVAGHVWVARHLVPILDSLLSSPPVSGPSPY